MKVKIDGERLRNEREKRGIQRKELAKRTGKSYMGLYGFECKEFSVVMDYTAEKIAEAIGCDVSSILVVDGNKIPVNGKAVRSIRKGLCLKQVELSRLLGYSFNIVGNVENGTVKSIPEETIEKFCEITKCKRSAIDLDLHKKEVEEIKAKNLAKIRQKEKCRSCIWGFSGVCIMPSRCR